jgi:hypothetical protein
VTPIHRFRTERPIDPRGRGFERGALRPGRSVGTSGIKPAPYKVAEAGGIRLFNACGHGSSIHAHPLWGGIGERRPSVTPASFGRGRQFSTNSLFADVLRADSFALESVDYHRDIDTARLLPRLRTHSDGAKRTQASDPLSHGRQFAVVKETA